MNRDSERFGFTPRLVLIAAVSVSVTLAGCARHPRTSINEQAARQAILEPPRSRLGNPPYYDVFGQRHYVLDTAAGYRRTGVASWYGEKFHGRSTSSGEPYDMFSHTAAHPTLPLPTWVEVTHLETGKQVIVKVNDRGPFVDNRIIDLSFGAAVVLDMVAQGTAPVEVRALGVSSAGEVLAHDGASARDPAGTTDATSTMPLSLAATSVPPSQRIYLQAGAFSRQDSAARFVEVLHAAGFERINVDADHSTSPGLYRVRLGPFSDVDAADAAVANLVAMGYERPYLVIGP